MTNYDNGDQLQLNGAKVPETPPKGMKKFNYAGIEIRTTIIDGEPWFVAKDVCVVLGIAPKNVTQTVKYLPSEFVSLFNTDVRGAYAGSSRKCRVYHVNEVGLKMLLMRSNKPEAVRFQQWVDSDVLPSIRNQDKQAIPITLEVVATPPKEATFNMLVELNGNQELGVSGRLLYHFLEVSTDYKDWFPRMCSYGFEEGHDYTQFLVKVAAQKRARTYDQLEHRLTLDMAKEISMLQRTERGKQARQYFIQIEKDWNSPDKVMARALKIAERQIGEYRALTATQQETIALLEPKANQYDKVMSAESTYTVTDVAFLNDWHSKKLFNLLVEIGWMDRGRSNKHYVTRNAPEGIFKIIKTIYGEQIRVTQAGYQAMKELINDK